MMYLRCLLLAFTCSQVAPDSPATIDHMVVIGASASAGWGVVLPGHPTEENPVQHRHVHLADTLAPAMGINPDQIKTYATGMFFSNPFEIGTAQITAAQKADPDLLIGLDFLFWYAYGTHNEAGLQHGDPDVDSRLKMVELGLDELDRLSTPMLIGDVPDVSSAADAWPIAMISASQIPSPSALARINNRIHAWAETRDHVTLIPLAQATQKIQNGELLKTGDTTWTSAHRLLQFDQLHPTADGLIALTMLTVDLIPQADRLKNTAENIRTKCVSPPHTTP